MRLFVCALYTFRIQTFSKDDIIFAIWTKFFFFFFKKKKKKEMQIRFKLGGVIIRGSTQLGFETDLIKDKSSKNTT